MARKPDRATAYARAVVARKVAAGTHVRLACERHLRDLKTASDRGLHFDVDASERACTFFTHLHHSKGKWAGQAFELAPWQCFIVGSLFGWKRGDGLRRFRTSLGEIARKNGKSTLAAGIGILLAFFDGEAGAEVYCAATKRDQAKIVFDEAARMVKATPGLKRRIRSFVGNLHSIESSSKLEPLGADADTTDGLNIHGALVDEVHAHRTRAMVDVLETGTGARTQPLTFYITTAGYDRNSVLWELHQYSLKVLEATVTDDTWFVFIAAADEGDDWRDEKTWHKANPNLGVSVHLDDLQRKCEKAQHVPAAQNAFRRLHLNEWTEQSERAIDMAVWDENAGDAIDEAELRGRACFGGLDLASTRDVTAHALVFPPLAVGEPWIVLPRFWLPEVAMRERSERDRVPYDVWVSQGWIRTTPGNVTDYDLVRSDIRSDADEFDIREIAYDRWNATHLVSQLQEDGAVMVPFGQGYQSMSGPTKELIEKLLLGRQLRHGGNPVLRWMASNFCVMQDPAGNLKPDKAKSTEKIDGMVALIMGLGRASVTVNEPPSVYDERGILAV